MGFHRSVRFLYNCCCCWLLLSLNANNGVVVTCSSSSSSSSSSTSLSNTVRVIDEFKNRLLSIRQQHQYQADVDDDDKTTASCYSSFDGGSIYYGIPRTILDSNFQRRHRRRRGDSSSSSNINEKNDDDEKQHNNDIMKRQQQYYEEYETIGKDVEKWALKMIREGTTTTKTNNNNNNNNNNDNDNDNGWKEIYCSKAFRHKFNTNYHNHNHNNNNNNTSSIPPRITTRQYIKWIPDSRDPKHQGSDVTVNVNQNNKNNSSKNQNQNQKNKVQQLHPCMKLIATIHAPSPIVCRYLSDRNNFKDYNSLLIEQKDMKIINSYSKICWSQSKKLLFIQPRDFVTYCRHRWLNNGRVQFITNQACEHTSSSDDDDSDDDDDDATSTTSSKYRAYSLRGATLISPCSSTLQDNEEQEQEQEKEIERTTIIMLSHCNCGNDIPEWAVRTAVGILAPIKPFEIIHRIEIGIQNSRYELEKAEEESSIKMKLSSSSSSSMMKKATASSSSSSLSWSSDDDDDERGKKRIITRRRSSRPAGIAQMGYGAFWPDGGGLLEEDNDDDEEDNLYFDETI